ncbi:MAG TPA: GNAT family N-acetyltransferase, partial [Prevotella sp.]
TCNARLAARDIGTVIDMEHALRWSRLRRRGVKRAIENGITVERSTDFAAFWQVLTHNLEAKYDVRPVHNLQEIKLLHSHFPNNMVLYNAYHNGQVVGGILLYITQQVVHAQYSSATPEGKRMGAIDMLYERIIQHDYTDYRYFDFGRSTENRGLYLNEPLIFQKEGFGGRGMCWDWYEWEISEDEGGKNRDEG